MLVIALKFGGASSLTPILHLQMKNLKMV